MCYYTGSLEVSLLPRLLHECSQLVISCCLIFRARVPQAYRRSHFKRLLDFCMVATEVDSAL